MRFVAVTTVHDDGAAQVAREKLADAGIPVELKSLGQNPYFGAVTAQEIEVRVPSERLAEAALQLEQLERQVEASLLAEAGMFGGDAPDAPDDEDDDEGGSMALPPPELRPLKLSWAIVLSLLLPFPAGCFYARAWKIGYLLCGLFAVGVVGSLIGHVRDAMGLALFAKGADAVLAPMFALVHNRRLRHSQDSEKNKWKVEKRPNGAFPR